MTPINQKYGGRVHPAPTEFPETHPWLLSREAYRRQRARRRAMGRALLVAAVVSCLAALAVLIWT